MMGREEIKGAACMGDMCRIQEQMEDGCPSGHLCLVSTHLRRPPGAYASGCAKVENLTGFPPSLEVERAVLVSYPL